MGYSITLFFYKLQSLDNSYYRRRSWGGLQKAFPYNPNPHIKQGESLGSTKAYSRLIAQMPNIAIRNYPTA
jgi:hypothetical protein